MGVANSIDLASVAEDHAVPVDGCRSEWTQGAAARQSAVKVFRVSRT